MKTILSLLLMLLCYTVPAQTTEQAINDHFHEPINAKIKLLTLDSVNFKYYRIWRFQFLDEVEKYGKLIVPKDEKRGLRKHSIHSLTLCDPEKFILVFDEKKSKSPNNQIIHPDDSISGQDTMHFHGPPLLNATISDEGILLLDFGNSAEEAVFEICKE